MGIEEGSRGGNRGGESALRIEIREDERAEMNCRVSTTMNVARFGQNDLETTDHRAQREREREREREGAMRNCEMRKRGK